MRGQAIAVSLVMGCGLAMLIMARSLIHSLESTRSEYYQAHRFAQVFVQLKRAPLSLLPRLAQIPGVAALQPGIAVQVTLDIPGLEEPASGMVRSVPDFEPPELNRLFLRSGKWLEPGKRREVLVGEAFAKANRLEAGQVITMILNGRLQQFRIAGIVLSPEYVFESRPGSALPDNRTYGIFWMSYEELSNAFDLYQAFNSLALTLEPGANERTIIAELDRQLLQYGARGAYGRKDHPSDIRVSDEIRVLRVLSIGFPLIFLSVAAFMTNSVVSRLLTLQREQIAILKAFGFSNRQIGAHYLKFALIFVLGGTVAGALGGVALGTRLVNMYQAFFRFPELHFRLDRTALFAAVGVGITAALVGVWGAVRRAAQLPPADAMRPEPPANYRPAFLERTGIGHWLSHTFRIAVRNLERKPFQALLTITGLTLATSILIIPNCFRDSVGEVLEFQWDLVQRHDLSLGLVEPDSINAANAFRQLPGAVSLEPFRGAAVRLRVGHRHRQLLLRGMPAEALHERVIDSRYRQVALPPSGIVMSAKLGEVLSAKLGDPVVIEVLEGKRTTTSVPVVGFSEDFAGIVAHMERHALNQLLGEGDIINGASFCIDTAKRSEFMRALKSTPRVGWVAIKESLRANFRATTAASINLIQSIYLTFATVVAFGVVYNNARISLAERSRELATLRVIGFSQREVAAVLVTELVILALIAVPLGLLVGTGFATGIVRAVNTETVRLPLVLTVHNYSFAVLAVTTASVLSALFVLRTLKRLDLVGVLKAPE